jgi:multidrug transporter EmrE-like cation transporter
MLNYLIFPFLILSTVGLNTVAQTLLKVGAGQSLLNVHLLGGILLYGLSTVFYILVLGRFNLSIAYPIVVGLTIASTTISGAFFLREKVLVLQWLGIGLILSGISAIALARSSQV